MSFVFEKRIQQLRGNGFFKLFFIIIRRFKKAAIRNFPVVWNANSLPGKRD